MLFKSANFNENILYPLFTIRRERDSNPRYAQTYTRFPGVLLRPLGHLSKEQNRGKVKPESLIVQTIYYGLSCIA